MPLRARTALPAILHYSIYLWAIGFHFAGNFSEAEKLPCSLLHLQHRAQCVAHRRPPLLLMSSLFSGKQMWNLSGFAGTGAIQRLQLFEISRLLACLVRLSKKLAHPWFLCKILFSLLVCENSQGMIQSFGYTELCYIKFNLRLGAIGEKFGNLWALYNKELAVRVNQFPHTNNRAPLLLSHSTSCRGMARYYFCHPVFNLILITTLLWHSSYSYTSPT